MTEIKLRPIGVVRNEVPFSQKGVDWSKIKSKVEIDHQFEEGLSALREFSHVFIVFWIDTGEVCLKVHPRGRLDLPEVGVFASRSPTRPNPIGLTLVRLLSLVGNFLIVEGLDAFDGSLVLDIKPFMMKSLPRHLRFPYWA